MPYGLLGGMLELCQPSLFMQCKSDTHRLTLNIFFSNRRISMKMKTISHAAKRNNPTLESASVTVDLIWSVFWLVMPSFKQRSKTARVWWALITFPTLKVFSQTVHLDAHATTLLAPARIRMSTKCWFWARLMMIVTQYWSILMAKSMIVLFSRTNPAPASLGHAHSRLTTSFGFSVAMIVPITIKSVASKAAV